MRKEERGGGGPEGRYRKGTNKPVYLRQSSRTDVKRRRKATKPKRNGMEFRGDRKQFRALRNQGGGGGEWRDPKVKREPEQEQSNEPGKVGDKGNRPGQARDGRGKVKNAREPLRKATRH